MIFENGFSVLNLSISPLKVVFKHKTKEESTPKG